MSSSVYDLIERHVDALLTALWYDYNEEYVIATVLDIKQMIANMGTRNCTEDASYIFKVLVLLYGDYGVAPAVGWIDDENKGYLLTSIDKWCKEMHLYEQTIGRQTAIKMLDKYKTEWSDDNDNRVQ